MNEKNGDVTVSAAEPPYNSLAEWQAQVQLVKGLSSRVMLCFAFGDPSIVDLKDAKETLEVLRALIDNLYAESARRSREAGGQS